LSPLAAFCRLSSTLPPPLFIPPLFKPDRQGRTFQHIDPRGRLLSHQKICGATDGIERLDHQQETKKGSRSCPKKRLLVEPPSRNALLRTLDLKA
jgi:hypothetical protein